MKIHSINRKGSVLIIVLLTITILTMICAGSLYITSQDANATTQATSWQQSLTGAEAAVDLAMNALDTNTWTGWYTVTGSLPKSKPTDTTTPACVTCAPAVGQYNYYVPPALSVQGEASNTMNMWVTVDPVNATFKNNNNQSYRVRATGVVGAPGPARVSNQKLDNDLRKISLRYDRNAGTAVTTPQASRTIEVIAQPVATTAGTFGIVSKNTFIMGGNGFIDSFDSSNPFKSTNGLYDQSKRQSHGDVGILNSTGSTLQNGAYLYGNLTYSGPAVQQTKNVQGTISTPFTATVPSVSAPNWPAGSYSTSLPAAQGNVITIQGSPNANPPTGTPSNPLRYQVSSIILSGHATISVKSPTDNTGNPLPGYDNVQIWITGTGVTGNVLSITGNNAGITQDSNASVTYWVQGDIYIAGQGIANNSGLAKNLIIDGVSPSNGSTQTAYIAGNGDFIGVLDLPAFNTTYAGNGDISGAIIANTLTIQGSGKGSFHYDEALNGLLQLSGPNNYSYASWFEDNGDKARGITF
jgi:hypothetical protein